MQLPDIRKEVFLLEETRHELGTPPAAPLRKGAAVAVVANPYAGQDVEDLSLLGEHGAFLGRRLAELALHGLGISAAQAGGYGMAAVTGLNGEQEHGAALLHMQFDAAVKEVLGGPKAIVPSTEKVASAGCFVDVPLHYKDAVKVRSFYDAMTIRVGDSPRPGEILVALCISTGPRPNARIGGVRIEDVKGITGID